METLFNKETKTFKTEYYSDFPEMVCTNLGTTYIAWTETEANRLVFGINDNKLIYIEANHPIDYPKIVYNPKDEKEIVICWKENGGIVVWARVKENCVEKIFQTSGNDPSVCFNSISTPIFFWCSPEGKILYCKENSDINEIDTNKAARINSAFLPNNKVLLVFDDLTEDGIGIYTALIDMENCILEKHYLLTENLRINYVSSLAQDSLGNVYFVWENCRPNSTGRGYDNFCAEEILQCEDTEKLGGKGYRLERNILGAMWNNETFRWVGGMIGESPIPLALNAVKPSVAIDDSKKLWLSYQSYNLNGKWDTWIQLITTGTQSQPIKVNENGGLYSRKAAIGCSSDNKIKVVTQKASGSGINRKSDIELLSFETTNGYLPKPVSRPIKLSNTHKTCSRVHYTTIKNKQKLSLFFGDIHMHSELSGCSRFKDGNIREKFDFCQKYDGLDFAALTDHSKEFNSNDWESLQEEIKFYELGGDFKIFPAYEFVENTDELSFHRQIIYKDFGLPFLFRDHEKGIAKNSDIWKRIGDMPILTVLHQPADDGMKAVYSEHDPKYQPVVEIFQLRGSYEKWEGKRWVFENRWQFYKNAADTSESDKNKKPEDWLQKDLFIQEALAKGLIFGFSGGGEHEGVAVTAVYSEDLSRESIFNAILQRRCYATSGAKIVLDVKVNENPMGSIIDKTENIKVDINVIGTALISKITIVKNNMDIFTYNPNNQSHADFLWCDDSDKINPNWNAPHDAYYIRVEQVDKHMAWSSPVYVGC